MNKQVSNNKRCVIQLTSVLFVLLICLLNPCIVEAQNDTIINSSNYDYSAWVLYDSVCMYMDSGKIELAEYELRRILDGIDGGEFVECADEEAVKHLQYKSHVVLANIAMAEKRIKELGNEVLFFENADTTYGFSVWFPNPNMEDALNDTIHVSINSENSAWVLYDSVCIHMNRGMIDQAEIELWTILEGIDEGEFVECSNEQVVKLLKYKAHVVLANIAIADNRIDELKEELAFFKKSDCFGLSVCFMNPVIVDEEYEMEEESVYSAWTVYDSVVSHIYKGDVELAKSELRTILDDIEENKFVECSDEHTLRLLQYKSHVVLANIAFAEKSMWDLDREISFFNNADTTKSEWKRAGYAATHFKHKYYQLQNGIFGKIVGDWVSLWQNKNGIPMVWIRFSVSNNTLHAELKECAMKGMLSTKYPAFTDYIALDNVKDMVEVDFGDSRLRPGLQFLPSAAIDIVNNASNMLSEAIARQNVAKTGTLYSSDAMWKQLGVDVATGIATALIMQMSVTKETVVSESFVMERIGAEMYNAKIRLRSLTAYSDGRKNDEFQWAEIPVIHLYAQEEQDFTKGHFDESIKKSFELLRDELFWENSEEMDEMSESVANDIAYGYMGVCNVENTQVVTPFYFLGVDINIHPNSAYSTFFSGLARAQHLFGYKEEPVNPRTNRSEVNTNIVPLRGTFKTIISSNECVTFTGDWNASEKTGNGLLSYVNTSSPEFNFTYEGTIWKGYPHGLGIWQGDSFRYVGWFYKGEKFGYGTMSYYDGREEQGFVTSFGDIIHESMISDAMKEDFNEKVKNISKLKYQVLDE